MTFNLGLYENALDIIKCQSLPRVTKPSQFLFKVDLDFIKCHFQEPPSDLFFVPPRPRFFLSVKPPRPRPRPRSQPRNLLSMNPSSESDFITVHSLGRESFPSGDQAYDVRRSGWHGFYCSATHAQWLKARCCQFDCVIETRSFHKTGILLYSFGLMQLWLGQLLGSRVASWWTSWEMLPLTTSAATFACLHRTIGLS